MLLLLLHPFVNIILFLKKHFSYIILLTFSCTVCYSICMAQKTDTLPNVKLHSKKPIHNILAQVPVQILQKNELEKISNNNVADAVKYFSGVLVKDYGGLGGLKTVSVRSLGAGYTGVLYDGLPISDAQAGQVDLGKISTQQLSQIQLYSGPINNLLLPARTYAYGAVLALQSREAADSFTKTQSILSLQGGSFGFINPAAQISFKTGNKLIHRINGSYLYSQGDYPFKVYENTGAIQRRQNDDMQTTRLEYDLQYAFSDSNTLQIKAYYYQATQGIPGGVIIYTNNSRQRLYNKNDFIQARWQKKLNSNTRVLLGAKYNYDYKLYRDPDFIYSSDGLENKYRQQEMYVSAAADKKLSSLFTIGISSDYFINSLQRKDKLTTPFASPVRYNWLSHAAVQSHGKKIQAQAGILYYHQQEKVKTGNAARPVHKLNPALSLAWQPFQDDGLSLRLSYKSMIRPPSFDDLYYTLVGNTALRPEQSQQWNMGIAGKKIFPGFLQWASLTVDMYENRVRDKILAVPRQNLFQWTMLNIGKVHAYGVDAGLLFKTKYIDAKMAQLRIQYSYQKSLDVSDKNSNLYKTQLPYTPVHSGSIMGQLTVHQWEFAASGLFSSYRYRLGDPVPDNIVKEWATIDLYLAYSGVLTKNISCKPFISLHNILNQQYEVIRFYPMPRFHYRMGINVNL